MEWLGTQDGLRLAADMAPGWRQIPVVLLHGGGQTRHAWGATATLLSERGWSTVSVDLRGHGDSDWSPAGNYGLEDFAADVASIAGSFDAPPVLVGASLGGLASLLALTGPAPPAATALVLVDVAHRFEHDGAQPIVDFMQANPEGFETPGDAELAVAAYLPHRRPPDDPNGILKNLRRREGRWHWHWDPSLLRSQRPLVEPPAARERARRLADGIRALSVPVLLIRGTISGVVTPEIAAEFSELNERAEVVEVAGAGHMVAGDRNDAFAGAVLSFLEERVPAA